MIMRSAAGIASMTCTGTFRVIELQGKDTYLFFASGLQKIFFAYYFTDAY
jgi:hypothetical protein